ncbi:sphingomyelin phosphodiesterase 4-like isoform X2 [Lycorma delicatula]
MNSILSLPLPNRCETIARLVKECTNKELENFFPLLIDDLFGITNQVGWKLRSIKFNSNPYEFEILTKFLHPNGPVFKLCYKLLSDCHLKYDFPLSYLPIKVQQMIGDGMVPSFYADKLQVDHKNRTPLGLALNPFELFMFHFVYHLVNPNIQLQVDANQWMYWEFLYIRLVEEYLNIFLPCNGSSVTPLSYIFSSQSPPRQHSVHFPTRPARSPTLLRQSVILNQSSSVQHGSLHTSVQATPTFELWRSELIAQLCIDFWLSTSSYDSQFYNTSNQLPFWTYPLNDTKSYQNFMGPVWSQQFLPTGEHLRVVRFLIKHLHYFANSLVDDSSVMDELKRVIIPSCQGKIYRFLRYTMQHWPLDTSFRLILETWLSYIQPWRYQDYSRRIRESDERSHSVDSHWMPFIAENLLGYSLIFQQLIVRFSRVDLATPKNAHMLYRVGKVFSLANLTDYLRDVEAALEEGKPVCSKWSGLVRQHIVDLEGSGFQYQALFGSETKSEVIRFTGQIQQALITAQMRLESESENQKISFLCLFTGQSFSSEYSVDERKKVITNLTSSLNALKRIFELEGIENQSISLNSSSFANTSNMKQDIRRIDYKRNMKDVKYDGDPDLQPIKSFENAFLVRALYHISSYISITYQHEIQQLYQRSDWCGGIMRQILRGPSVIHTYDNSGPGGYSPRVARTLPPRLSLRIWAHHRTLVLLFIAFILLRFFGYPTVLVIIIALIVWFLFLFFIYLIGWAPKPPHVSSFNSSF